MEERLTELLEERDLFFRTIGNRNIPPIYKLLYLALIDTHPELLSGQETEIRLHQIRERAGWPSKTSATHFMRDLQKIGAITYDPGTITHDMERVGRFTANLRIFTRPETFNLRAEKDYEEPIEIVIGTIVDNS